MHFRRCLFFVFVTQLCCSCSCEAYMLQISNCCLHWHNGIITRHRYTQKKSTCEDSQKKKQRKKCLMKLYLLRAEYATRTNPCVCVFRVHTNGLVSRHVISHISYNVRNPFINLWQKRFGATAQLLVNEFQIEEQITLYRLQSCRLYGTVALVEAFTPAAQTTMTTM